MKRYTNNKSPKILLLDIETAPMLAYVWSIWEQNVGLNQIKADWHLLSWAAKWLDDSPTKIMYMDQRNRKDLTDDKEILKGIWDLMDEADIIITQNGRAFDNKKLNARFVMNGLKPPSPYKQIDTKELAKKKFGFTSNKLEYMTDKLCKKYKKLKHGKFSGMELWIQCLKNNPAAWREMEKYNKYDVLSLEELYNVLSPWDTTINFNLYRESGDSCNCGSKKFHRRGFAYTNTGKFQRLVCIKCGSWTRDNINLIDKFHKKSLRKNT